MRRILITVALVALSAMVSCQKEEALSQKEAKPIVFTASIATPSDTKVSVDVTNGKVAWVKGDKITISKGSSSGVYIADNDGATTTFTYESGTKFSNPGKFSATYGTMPLSLVDQVYDATPGNLIYMTAEAEVESVAAVNFTFNVECGLLKLNLTDANKSVSRISVTSTDGYTYTLICSEAQSITSAKDFYIALPEGKYNKYVIYPSSGSYAAVKTAKTGKETSIVDNQINNVTFSSLTFATPIYPESNTVGIKIGSTWWAPENCGYEPANGDYKGYPYGKLYQWGRKYGQGYTDYDATTPTKAEYWTGINGNEDSNTFYTYCDKSYNPTYERDWIKSGSNTYWNTGSESAPQKTTFDPCPTDWRIPTYNELNALTGNSGTTDISGGWDDYYKGYWFNGTSSPSTGNGLFLPAAGSRDVDGGAYLRNQYGYYWSSSVSDYCAWEIFFGEKAHMAIPARANGFSVRCVHI